MQSARRALHGTIVDDSFVRLFWAYWCPTSDANHLYFGNLRLGHVIRSTVLRSQDRTPTVTMQLRVSDVFYEALTMFPKFRAKCARCDMATYTLLYSYIISVIFQFLSHVPKLPMHSVLLGFRWNCIGGSPWNWCHWWLSMWLQHSPKQRVVHETIVDRTTTTYLSHEMTFFHSVCCAAEDLIDPIVNKSNGLQKPRHIWDTQNLCTLFKHHLTNLSCHSTSTGNEICSNAHPISCRNMTPLLEWVLNPCRSCMERELPSCVTRKCTTVTVRLLWS